MSVVSPEVPAVETLVDAIAHWAGKRGEEIALDFRARAGAEPVALTYAQLSASARALAPIDLLLPGDHFYLSEPSVLADILVRLRRHAGLA